MRLGFSSRSNDVVEPMIKPQWFVNCQSMAKQALEVAMDGEIPRLEFIPKQYLAEWKRFSYIFFLLFISLLRTEYASQEIKNRGKKSWL